MSTDELQMGGKSAAAIAKAKKLAREGDSSAAISMADDFLTRDSGEIDWWLVRGFAHELEDKYEMAAEDLTRAIQLNSLEPHLFYSRGRYLFQICDYFAAISDFNEGLSLCDFHKNDYYREELHFWRAETLLRLGRKDEALEDTLKLSDDFSSWTDVLRTKRDLLKDCNSPKDKGDGGSAASRVASSR